MIRGGANVVPEALTIDEISDLIAEKKVTITMLVSSGQGLTLVNKAMNEGKDFSPLRLIVSGGGLGEKTMQLLKLLCGMLQCDFMESGGRPSAPGR